MFPPALALPAQEPQCISAPCTLPLQGAGQQLSETHLARKTRQPGVGGGGGQNLVLAGSTRNDVQLASVGCVFITQPPPFPGQAYKGHNTYCYPSES